MSDDASFKNLTQAVQRYFDLMYDADLSRFDHVFYPSAQLHGFRDGKMTAWPMPQYREILAGRKSPRSLGSPREEAILMMDFASPTQALVKVRVRINDLHFVDHLTYHLIDGEWLITSKGYSLERKNVPARS
jgi:hypothetical protein